MKAVTFKSYGGPEVLELVELERPRPAADQVLLRVEASSVNPVDWKFAAGKLRFIRPIQLPFVPGFDVAGEVIECGAQATGFKLGDRVHARLEHAVGAASAEYSVAGVNVTTHMPQEMSFADAAAMPLAGMTALQGLRDRLRLPLSGAKERVLIVGASGGVGHFAVQIARAAGAYVVGVTSTRNLQRVLELGAQEVVDYTQPNPYQGQAPFDLIYDCVGGSPYPWLSKLTARGRFASSMPGLGVFLRSALNSFTQRSVLPVMLKTNASDLTYLDTLYQQGKLRVLIDSRFRLEELKAAWEKSRTGRVVGKIVIDVN